MSAGKPRRGTREEDRSKFASHCSPGVASTNVEFWGAHAAASAVDLVALISAKGVV